MPTLLRQGNLFETSPVGDVINKMLLEHKAPSFDDVQEGLLEWLGIYSEPEVEDCDWLNDISFLIYSLIRINLDPKQ